MLASSVSDARATTSAAVGPDCPIRMSSGPPRRKEKPRSAWSSCIEETPTSITTPSTASIPCRAQTSARSGKAVFDQHEPAIGAVDEIETISDRAAVAVDADHPRCGNFQDRPAVAAGAKGGVDIDAAAHAARAIRPPRGQARRCGGREVMPKPRPRAGKNCGNLDSDRPMAPQISALGRSFPGERPLALARRDVPRQAANPDLSTELAGLPWHFKRERGPRPSPKTGSALHHLVTAFRLKKALMKSGAAFAHFGGIDPRPLMRPAHTPPKCAAAKNCAIATTKS